MTVFIRVNEDKSVTLAGTVVTDEMLESGYVAYSGPLPTNSNTRWLAWDDNKKEVVENVEKRVSEELTEIRRLRDIFLKESDWVAAKALETGKPADPVWVDYRQALRDLPDAYVMGQQLVWPKRPDGVETVVTFSPPGNPGRMDNDGNPIEE